MGVVCAACSIRCVCISACQSSVGMGTMTYLNRTMLGVIVVMSIALIGMMVYCLANGLN